MAYIGNVCHACHACGFSSTNVYLIKAQWNSFILHDSIPQGEIERMMDNSYMLVVSKRTKNDQASILVHL